MSTSRHDETWLRIRAAVAIKPDGEGREATWLAERLKTSVQRINNWKLRGVPASALADIAAALGWSINQVLGLTEPPTSWPFETIDPERFARLTPHQAALVELAARNELEKIEAMTKRDGTSG